MATYVPAKRGVEYVFYIALRSQADSTIFQSNPTLAAGDFKISKDGGALANPGTLPAVTPGASKAVKVTLSATEMEADNLVLIASDAAGAEWMDGFWNIQTAARQIDDLAFPNTSGRGMDVDASGGVEVGSFQAGAITAAAIADGAIDAATFAANALDAVWATAARTLTANPGLDAAAVRAALGMAAANLDAQLDALPTAAENRVEMDANSVGLAAIFARIGAPAGASIAADLAAVFARTDVATSSRSTFDPATALVEGAVTWVESARGWNAAMMGKASGLDTATATYRDLGDTKDRLVATVDADGNRTAVVRDLA